MNNNPPKIEGLKFIEEQTWDQVFKEWQSQEGSMREWHEVAKKKGWDTWEDWRGVWLENIGASRRRWLIYQIAEPLKSIPEFRVGPTQTWQNNFPKDEANQHTFGEIVDLVSYRDNQKVQQLIKNFPPATQFIGVVFPNNKIHVIEGHHRVTAIAYAAKEGLKIDFVGLPTIALATFTEDEKELLDAMLKRGTFKNPPKQ